MSGPLHGIRLIEVGHMLMGPYCGMLLADLGAEVVKVEPPGGDIARTIGPHRIGRHNAYFASLNRNKRSVVLDLACDAGQRGLGELATSARGLITNLRPAAIKKLGLTYESMRKWNPGIVCVALTGYGLDGPCADRPAYDYVIQALTGIMSLTGDPHDAPTKAGYSAVDNSTAMLGAVGLLAKLLHGGGGQVDIAMYDTMLSQLNYLASAWLNAKEPARRYANSAHPYIVPAQNFRTRDGWLTLFITHDGFWKDFCEEIGRSEWVVNPKFATMAARHDNRDVVLRALEEMFVAETTSHWLNRLTPLGLVIAGVESLEEALTSVNTFERAMVVEIPTAECTIRVVGNPVKMSGFVDTFTEPPLLGQHNNMYTRTGLP